MFDYFHANEHEQYIFLQMPIMLIKDDKFKSLSDSAKILYSLLLNRTYLSAKNGWKDKDNRVYIIYTIKEIMEDLNCWEQKAVKAMNELKAAGLIKTVRRGLGKANLIYVMNFATGMKYQQKSVKDTKIKTEEVNHLNSENHHSGTSDTNVSETVIITVQDLPESQRIYTEQKENNYKATDKSESKSKSKSDEADERMFAAIDRARHRLSTVSTIDENTVENSSENNDKNNIVEVISEKIENNISIDAKNAETTVKSDVTSVNTVSANIHEAIKKDVSPLTPGETPTKNLPHYTTKEKYLQYLELMKENIQYNYFAEHRKEDMELVDSLVGCAVEMLANSNEYIRINNEKALPKSLVTSMLMKLTAGHIEHLLFKIKPVSKPIRRVSSYIKTCLTNVLQEKDLYYSNRYNRHRVGGLVMG